LPCGTNYWNVFWKVYVLLLLVRYNVYVFKQTKSFFGNMINLKSEYLVLNRLIGNFITLFRLMALLFDIKNLNLKWLPFIFLINLLIGFF